MKRYHQRTGRGAIVREATSASYFNGWLPTQHPAKSDVLWLLWISGGEKKSAFQLITATANTAGLVELSVQP